MHIKHRLNTGCLVIRTATQEDVDQILKLDNEVWTDFPASKKMITSRILVFPQGNFVAVFGEEIVGYLALQFLDYDLNSHPVFTWNEISDNGTMVGTHKLEGKFMYGVGMTVSPRFQNMGVATKLIFAGWSLIVRYNKQGCLLGSRIPDYHIVSVGIAPEEYLVYRREDGKLYDSELRLYESDGFKIICLLPGYENDPHSHDYGVLVYQANPFYNKLPWFVREIASVILARWGHKIIGV